MAVVHRASDRFDCIDEFPMHWVRGNQLGILLSIMVAVAAQQELVLLVPLAVQLVSRFFGIRYNLFVRVFSPLMPKSAKTESRELLRFNNLLAILFLAFSLVFFLLGIDVAGYLFLGMLTIAVVLALSGFCLGCFIYYQWKKFRARRLTG